MPTSIADLQRLHREIAQTRIRRSHHNHRTDAFTRSIPTNALKWSQPSYTEEETTMITVPHPLLPPDDLPGILIPDAETPSQKNILLNALLNPDTNTELKRDVTLADWQNRNNPIANDNPGTNLSIALNGARGDCNGTPIRTWLPLDVDPFKLSHRDEFEGHDDTAWLYLFAGYLAYRNDDKWINFYSGGELIRHSSADPRSHTVIRLGRLRHGTLEDITLPRGEAFTLISNAADAAEHCHPGVLDWVTKQDGIEHDSLLLLCTQQCRTLGHGPLAQITVAARDTFSCLDRHVSEYDRYTLYLRQPEYDPEKKQLKLYQNAKDALRGRKTSMKIGKALRTVFKADNYSDERIKELASILAGALQPPELVIGYEKTHFDEAFTKGPSSCMTYKNQDYYVIRDGLPADTDIRPTDAYITGNIGVAYLRAGDRVTARALFVKDTKEFARIYSADYSTPLNNGDVLRDYLEKDGYTENRRAFIGQELIPIRTDLKPGHDAWKCFDTDHELSDGDAFGIVAPYVDWDNLVLAYDQNTNRLWVTDHESESYHFEEFGDGGDAVEDTRGATHLGQVYYQAGGCLMFDIDRLQNGSAGNRSQAREYIDAGISSLFGDGRLFHALVDVINERDSGFDENEIHSFYDPSTGITAEIAEDEADRALSRCGRTFSTLLDDDQGFDGLVPQDQTSLTMDGTTILTEKATDLGYAWDEEDDEWIPEDDAVHTECGTTTHRVNAHYHEPSGKWYLNESDIPDDEDEDEEENAA